MSDDDVKNQTPKDARLDGLDPLEADPDRPESETTGAMSVSTPGVGGPGDDASGRSSSNDKK